MFLISRRENVFRRAGFGFFSAMTLTLTVLTGRPALADPINCEKVRTGTDPIRFTFTNTVEGAGKAPSQQVIYNDVVRSSPDGIVIFSYAGTTKYKSVISSNLIPLSIEVVGKTPARTITYDADISALSLSPGSTFAVNSIEEPVGGVSTMGHHDYSISDGGHFDLAGCSFPVLAVHHTTHYRRDKAEWDVTLDSLVSADLKVALHRKQTVVGLNLATPSSFTSVATDLSTSADMTKAP